MTEPAVDLCAFRLDSVGAPSWGDDRLEHDGVIESLCAVSRKHGGHNSRGDF
jgi:hypothetical protein